MLIASSGVSKAADCTPLTKEITSTKLGKLYAYAIDLTSGKVLVDKRSREQTAPASVMKLVSAAAAVKYIVQPRLIQGLPDYRATTSVLTVADEPGTIILRGGGDHTLSRVAVGSYTTYSQPAKLRDLASQAVSVLGANPTITKIVLDDTFFKGPSWNPNWASYSRTAGDAAPITGLMVDSARVNPDLTSTSYNGVRVADPTTQAGSFFKQWLAFYGANLSAVTIVKGATPQNATVIATANSQPISTWIRHALKISDNTETEIIARHTYLSMGLPNNYLSVQIMGTRLFNSEGFSAKNLVMKDAAGLAAGNRITPRMLVGLLRKATNPEGSLGMLPSLMATSGDGGTLGGRFLVYNKTTKHWDLVIPNGAIRAKTGTISGVYSLAGIVTTAENHKIVFAIFANRDLAHGFDVGSGTRTAIDAVVDKLYLCGATY